MVKTSSEAATQFTKRPSEAIENAARSQPETRRLAGRDTALRNRPAGGACHARVDVGVVPHIERAGGAGADGDAEQRRERDHRMHMAGRNRQPDQRREHYERHHPRLEQRQVIADTGDAGLNSWEGDAHRTSGSVSYWWNGGGDGSVHSSVVAPGPHGLAAARSLRTKACTMPKKNTNVPKPEMYAPIEEM